MNRSTSHSRNSLRIAAAALCFVVAALAAILVSPAKADAKDKPEDYTRVYQHTYDEVFQATQKAIERMGCFVKTTDQAKGAIAGNGKCATGVAGFSPTMSWKVEFEVRIETVSAKPETRVSVEATTKGQFGNYGGVGGARKAFKEQLLSEIQKVLATY